MNQHNKQTDMQNGLQPELRDEVGAFKKTTTKKVQIISFSMKSMNV